MCSISSGIFAFCRNISYTISYTYRKHVSGTFEKCGPFFYLGVAQLEKLFSYLNENRFILLLGVCQVMSKLTSIIYTQKCTPK